MSAHMQKASFAARVHSQGHRPLDPAGDGEPDAVLKAALNHTPPKNHAHAPHRHGVTHLLTALTPLVLGELIHDANKRWKWIRIGSLATAVVGELELCWQDRVRQREWKEREASHGREVAQR
jgi:hypothetical protein